MTVRLRQISMTRIGLVAPACEGYCLIAVGVLILVAGITTGTNEGSVKVCEFEDANLIFPNIPAGSVGDIRAKTWNKENGVLLASWMANTNFVTSPSYGDRLMAVGENGIKIRNATRSDTGTYTLVLTSGSTQDFLEFLVHLEVLVSPSIQCTPNITRKGDSLIAKLPSEACGFPKLIPSWINRTQNIIQENINVLDIDLEIQGEIYVVCAMGESKRCFRGDNTYMCANYTKQDLKIESRSTVDIRIIIPAVSVFILIVGVILAYCFIRKSRRKESPAAAVSDEVKMNEVACESQDLLTGETSAIDLEDIKRHLIHQYKTIKNSDLTSSGIMNLPELSQLYFDLQITILRLENFGDRKNMSAASLHDIFSIGKSSENKAEYIQPIPAVIMGQCGIGKSTWCQHIVKDWCSYNVDMELNVTGRHIPEVARFEILLFVPLKNRLEGHSFADCLRQELFCNDSLLFVKTMNYISKHGESVLIIIDGIDAVTDNLEPIGNLLKSKENFPCTTVLTSRPDGLECLQKKEKITLRLFKMHGLGLEKAKEYATNVIGIYCKNNGVDLSAEQFWEGIRNHQVQSLFHVPLLCSSFVICWMQNNALLDNLTDFLLILVECYMHRAMTRRWFSDNIEKVLENKDFKIKIKDKIYTGKYVHILRFTSNVAKQIFLLPKKNNQSQKAIEIGKLTRDIGEVCIQLCVETGILDKTFVRSKKITVAYVSFSHVLLLDFFVALSLAMGKRDSSSKNVELEKVAKNIANIMDMLQELDPEYWTRKYRKRQFWQ